MRKIREVLRLKWDRKLSNREIGLACSLGRSTVGEYLERAKRAGLSWPIPEEIDDIELEQLLFANSADVASKNRPFPDWAVIHKEYKRKGVTLNLLWQEYKANNPNGYQYTQFTILYRKWSLGLDPVMRQVHRAGEKVFVDYAGQTTPVHDALTGDIRQAQLFLAVLGASNYTFAEATWTQTLPDWIGSHVRAFAHFEGVPEVAVPDNLKAGVTSPCRYEPDLNPTYRDLANHYDISVLPARVRKPRDKAKVENGVLQAERWILARLRNRKFFDLVELNSAIKEQLYELNHRPFQKLPGSRASVFEELERPALRPLPKTPYEFAEWKKVTAGPDYHVEADGHYYSVPHLLIGRKIDIRLTQRTVECFQSGGRVASHLRNELRGKATTVPAHMPEAHRRYHECGPEQILNSAEMIAPEVGILVKSIMESKQYPQAGVRSSLGVLHLAKEYGRERLAGACRRALAMQALSYRSVQSILKAGLDQAPLPEPPTRVDPIDHENLRGPQYYN